MQQTQFSTVYYIRTVNNFQVLVSLISFARKPTSISQITDSNWFLLIVSLKPRQIIEMQWCKPRPQEANKTALISHRAKWQPPHFFFFLCFLSTTLPPRSTLLLFFSLILPWVGLRHFSSLFLPFSAHREPLLKPLFPYHS